MPSFSTMLQCIERAKLPIGSDAVEFGRILGSMLDAGATIEDIKNLVWCLCDFIVDNRADIARIFAMEGIDVSNQFTAGDPNIDRR